MSKIIPIRIESTDPIINNNDKHVQMAEEIAAAVSKQRNKPQKNLTPVVIHHANRTNKVALIVAPMWGAQVAPYGAARLAGLSRHLGFETKCWDINVKCFNQREELWSHLVDWKWANKELYEKDIQPIIFPILEEFLDELVKFNPTVVGFTVYYTNINCISWLIPQIREKLPNAKIIAGGPEARQLNERIPESNLFDYIVRGEGEIIFSKLLDDIENNVAITQKFLDHDKNIRIDLDSMPIPDYRDFDINLYQYKGITSELSRGCVAKCTFCQETTVWRYRGRMATSVLDEIEYNYKTFGIEVVWFIDSLVNGNLTELLAFCQGLIDRNIKIKWWGFARNDKRMTKEYLKTLVNSGCWGLAIGMESGSQKVIDLIEKKVEIEAVEQNFKDLAELGFSAGTSWFVGFPGEMLTDVAQTLTLVWRLRDAGISSKGFGICNLDPDSPIGVERERFNISYKNFGGNWFTNDLTNTIAHRIIRYKSVYILLDHYRLHKVRRQYLGMRGQHKEFITHYDLKYNVDHWIDDVKFDLDFDFNIIKPNINPFADSLVNEIWPLLRVLWLAMGPFTFNVRFDPEIDYPVYGDVKYFWPRGSGGLWADYKFNINENGVWDADFYTKIDCKSNSEYNFEHKWTGTGQWDRS